MKRIICIGLSSALVGCCPTKIAQTEQRDSVSVKVIYQKEIVKDTIPYYLPVEVESVKTVDTISYLENRWAYSEAVISEGMLTHSLGTKTAPQQIVVDKIIEYRDSIIYDRKEVVKIEEVEKPLSWWQETQIKGFWAMVSILAMFILWKFFCSKFGGLLSSIANLFKGI